MDATRSTRLIQNTEMDSVYSVVKNLPRLVECPARPRGVSPLVHRHPNAGTHQRTPARRPRAQERANKPIQRRQYLLPIHFILPFFVLN